MSNYWTTPRDPERQNRIWTDGSSGMKSGWCGWAYHGFVQGKTVVACGYERGTNQRAELRAIVEALRAVPAGERLEIISDSEYAIFSLTKYREKWEKNGFKSATAEPIKHVDLVKAGIAIVDRLDVKFTHVRGHTGERGNELADILSKSARYVAEGRGPLIDVRGFLSCDPFVV